MASRGQKIQPHRGDCVAKSCGKDVDAELPMGFLFTACVRDPGHDRLEEVPDTSGRCDGQCAAEESDDEYVARTFHWKPEDFPLEIATYMQCEEPWKPETLPYRQNVSVSPKVGKALQSCKLRPLCADDLPSMAEEVDGGIASADEAEAEEGLAGEAEESDGGWTPDWSLLQPPPPPPADAGDGIHLPGCPLEPEPHAQLPGFPDAEAMADEVRQLRETVRALQRENELLRAAPSAAA